MSQLMETFSNSKEASTCAYGTNDMSRTFPKIIQNFISCRVITHRVCDIVMLLHEYPAVLFAELLSMVFSSRCGERIVILIGNEAHLCIHCTHGVQFIFTRMIIDDCYEVVSALKCKKC
ncbi:hypothetical protein HMPREF2806_07130 [Corynebacterium sp. HMSC076G08]|uniref:Uncharacterized protein n=1 Tax=Corynebacterium minutissimum TaxID=38301 RepID=A0ACC4UA86_9CORY|nr:hypothetical protein WU87_07905 [Corynebacterium minutissimum]OFK68239.1 hypothetical protein HMPREF2806_07130 [Corynebacterium sp. HMSC076G08]OFN79904.1 hypothetical protein HMPREF2526_06440 [Corynebacterium sp. HMSC070E08]OFP36893.1 hypothetical protein HMPREF2990_04410 [Corynebacterium sp. HMSC071B10]OHF43070.1 hypothetical protein HMPREF2550_00020 [Corynebacterium sp. HMSC074A01]OHO51193.1 hypothetical protein HMPREF2635_01865 [Corynebacterium sp. HMSC035E02]